MYRYLTEKEADYTPETLDIPCQVSLPETGDKQQVVHVFDDGSISVIGLSTTSFFDLQLQWSYISESDKDVILSLWHSASKADGRRRTIYWEHPTDNHTYTIRFMSELKIERFPGLIMSLGPVNIRVEGNKPT